MVKKLTGPDELTNEQNMSLSFIIIGIVKIVEQFLELLSNLKPKHVS